MTLSLSVAGGAKVSYQVAYQTGSTAPETCALGATVNVGNVLTYNVPRLVGEQIYSFRVCLVDGSSNYSFGETSTATAIAGWYQEAYIKAANNNASDYFGY